MKKNIIDISLLVLAASVLCGLVYGRYHPTDWNDGYRNGVEAGRRFQLAEEEFSALDVGHTNEPILTIANPQIITVGNGIQLIRVNDEQWHIITNSYAGHFFKYYLLHVYPPKGPKLMDAELMDAKGYSK